MPRKAVAAELRSPLKFSVMMTCWQCATEAESALLCPHCQALQPPPNDYFTFFGLPRKLAIDTERLQVHFYELSRKLHPDKYSRKSERERGYSTAATAILNDGWRTLKNPVLRAEYLLTQEGLEMAEQRTKDVPPELLEEVFELNMALEELRSGDDSAKKELSLARDRFAAMMLLSDAELQRNFLRWDNEGGEGGEGGMDALGAIRAVLNRRRYISKDVEKELS